MKKKNAYIALLLAMTICIGTFSCTAYSENLSDFPSVIEKKIIDSDIEIEPYLSIRKDNKSLDLSTEDVVNVHEDGSIDIVADGVSMTIVPPFGWILLTQDVFAQLDTYMMITNDIEGLLDLLKESKTHVYTLDLMTMANINFRIEEDALSKLLNNIREVSDSLFPKILEVLRNSYKIDDISVFKAGDNQFFKIDGRSQGYDVIVYTTFIHGKTLDICCYAGNEPLSDYDIEIIETMLSDLIIS